MAAASAACHPRCILCHLYFHVSLFHSSVPSGPSHPGPHINRQHPRHSTFLVPPTAAPHLPLPLPPSLSHKQLGFFGSAMAPTGIESAIESSEVLPKEAKKILHSLASSWSDVVDRRALDVVRLKGAMTNQVYQIEWRRVEGEGGGEDAPVPPPRKVLLRIYGEGVDVFFDRADEVRTFECMSRLGYGPRLLGRFPNGRVEEFIHARTLSASDLRDPQISSLIALKLREFHDLDMPGEKTAAIWTRLRNWLDVAIRYCSSEESEEFRLDSLEKEISVMERSLSAGTQRIGFCHNDLQYGNIMMEEETRSVTIIDYEYASFNPIAYDIANHFCEMAADYHTDTPHILNFDKYPGLEEQKKFVRTYLASSGKESINAEVDGLIQDIEKYAVASHLLWALWGIISDRVNEIDFDYKEYARQRFRQYWLKKPIVL